MNVPVILLQPGEEKESISQRIHFGMPSSPRFLCLSILIKTDDFRKCKSQCSGIVLRGPAYVKTASPIFQQNQWKYGFDRLKSRKNALFHWFPPLTWVTIFTRLGPLNVTYQLKSKLVTKRLSITPFILHWSKLLKVLRYHLTTTFVLWSKNTCYAPDEGFSTCHLPLKSFSLYLY